MVHSWKQELQVITMTPLSAHLGGQRHLGQVQMPRDVEAALEEVIRGAFHCQPPHSSLPPIPVSALHSNTGVRPRKQVDASLAMLQVGA